MRREYEDKEREWETENTDLKNEVCGVEKFRKSSSQKLTKSSAVESMVYEYYRLRN